MGLIVRDNRILCNEIDKAFTSDRIFIITSDLTKDYHSSKLASLLTNREQKTPLKLMREASMVHPRGFEPRSTASEHQRPDSLHIF
jgi:hypothetical protein